MAPPIPGRAARIIKSEPCKPPDKLSSSWNPVGTPDNEPSDSSLRCKSSIVDSSTSSA